MIRVQRPRRDQKTTVEKRQTVIYVGFVECLSKSAPIHEWANMHGGCRVEVEVEEEVQAKNMNPGIRDLGSDAMTSPYPTATVSW